MRGKLVERMCGRVHWERRAGWERERRGPRGAIARGVVVVAGRGGNIEDIVGRRRAVVVVRTDGALCRPLMRRWMRMGDETGELVGEIHVAAASARAVVACWREFSKCLRYGEIRWRGDEEVLCVEIVGAVGGSAVAARGCGGRRGGEMEALLAMGLVV
jgi:hypothetical protein